MMTSKERMLTALRRGKPDRLPITIHQWQPYHLQHYMGGVDQIEAFRAIGLDASVTPLDVMSLAPSECWIEQTQEISKQANGRRYRITVHTPDGDLSMALASDPYTTYHTEPLIKNVRDMEVFLKHWPRTRLDRERLTQWYDRCGDDGIVRGFVCSAAQPGPWQEFCELIGTQEAIYWAMDDPDSVHHFLAEMTRRKVEYVHEELADARFDLIEHGGGAASSTVISPAMFDEFCVPYDRRIIDALHEVGLPVVYHTCGGMMAILDRVAANGCDASETLSPPGVGGDIATREQRQQVKHVLGAKVALIGGIDQSRLDQPNTPKLEAEISAAVRDCFETFGAGGGYICSASDHFFHAPPANLRAMVRAADHCRYG
jgi:uroporphyrinogen-III decarboxylase